MYDWATAAKFPMRSGKVDFVYHLRTLEALDGLKSLCGERGSCLSPLCRFRLSDIDWGELSVETRHDGHRVKLDVTGPGHKKRVERLLGLGLKSRGVT